MAQPGQQVLGVLVVGVGAVVVGQAEQVGRVAVERVAQPVAGRGGLGVVGFGGEHPVQPGQALGGAAEGAVQFGDVDGEVAAGVVAAGRGPRQLGLPDCERLFRPAVRAQGVAEHHGGQVAGGQPVGPFGEFDGSGGGAEAAGQAGGHRRQQRVVAVAVQHGLHEGVEGPYGFGQFGGERVRQRAGRAGHGLGDGVRVDQAGQVLAGEPGGVRPGAGRLVLDGGGQQADGGVPVPGGGLHVGPAGDGAEVHLAVQREQFARGRGAAGRGGQLGQGLVQFGQLRVVEDRVGEVVGGVREVPGVDRQPGDRDLPLGRQPLVVPVRVTAAHVSAPPVASPAPEEAIRCGRESRDHPDGGSRPTSGPDTTLTGG